MHFHRLGCRYPDGRCPAPEDYIAHPDVNRILHCAKSNYSCDSAPDFEFIDGVKKMRLVVFDNDSGPLANNFTMQLYTWALITMMLKHQARKSDFAGHAPGVRLRRRPPLAAIVLNHMSCCVVRVVPCRVVPCRVVLRSCRSDACSLETPNDLEEWMLETTIPTPKWFSFVFSSWKGVGKEHVKPHRVRCDRNMISPFYCGVHAYMEFACASGLGEVIALEQSKPGPDRAYVPLFPWYHANGFDFYRPVEETMLDTLLNPVLNMAFPEFAIPITPHSMRVVACIWHLRCCIEEHRTRLGGRWLGMNLQAWERYARGGSDAAEVFRRKGVIDPIFMFWCASDSFVAFV